MYFRQIKINFYLPNCERLKTKHSIITTVKQKHSCFILQREINLWVLFMYFLRAQNPWQINSIEIFCPDESTLLSSMD